MKKRTLVIIMTALTLLVAISLLILLRYSSPVPQVNINNCANPRISLKYNACYNSLTESISIKITNNEENYEISAMSIIFSNPNPKVFDIPQIPKRYSTEQCSFHSLKNPARISIETSLKNMPEEFCNKSSSIIVLKNCDISSQDLLLNLGISNYSSFFIPEELNQTYDTDTFSPDLFDERELFSSSCRSNWVCKDWEECINDIQRRECIDLSRCI
ncbi:MAG: hypothetical protein KKB21_00745, partial [Nanoarchaeota archaeon]|nr:hypothetical protein [Nanoarchaeota archaeon]